MSIWDTIGGDAFGIRQADAWRKMAVELLDKLGYKRISAGPLPGSIVVEGPQLKPAETGKARRWLVLCRLEQDPPVISVQDLISYIYSIEAQGVIGFDFPGTNAQQKSKFESLPDSFAYDCFAPKEVVKDKVTDPEEKKEYSRLYKRLELVARARHAITGYRRPVLFVMGFVFLWILVATGVQYGWWGPVIFYLILLGVVFVVSLFFNVTATLVKAWGPYVVGLVGIPVVLSWLVGPYNGWRDLVLSLVIFAGVSLFGSRLVSPVVSRVRRPDPARQQEAQRIWRRRAKAAGWLIITWVAISAADAWLGPNWWSPIKPLAKPRSVELKAERSNVTKPRVGLALSGGGYRAALYHAGVLAALDDRDINIPVGALATVSGGSIIGGYYALGGDPDLFREAVSQGRFNLKRELFGIHNLLRLPCPGRIPIKGLELLWFCSFGRDDVQRALLNKNLFDKITLKDLVTNNNSLRWIIAGTDLVTGQAIGFSADGIIRCDQAAPRAGVEQGTLPNTRTKCSSSKLGELEKLQVAKLVAASGAFPGAFQAATFSDSGGLGEIQIADGGLTDNFGFALLASAHKIGPSWEFDLILVSDGSQSLKRGVKKRGISQLMRAMDVVYASAGIEPVSSENRPRVIRLSPQLLDSDDKQVMEHIAEFFFRRDQKLTVADVEKRVKQCNQVFLETTTLKDQFHPDEAQCIYDLGFYLVVANFPSITAALHR